MYMKDGDEKDEEGDATDKNISLYLKVPNSLGKELNDKCFVDLEISIYSWINSIDHEPSGFVKREDIS
jgi:hypothetical protein